MNELAMTTRLRRRIAHALQKLIIARRMVAEAEQELRAAIDAAQRDEKRAS